MKKTGLLFGSFNPIHIGHLMIAGYMYEFSDLAELWFVVSPLNPLKEKLTYLQDKYPDREFVIISGTDIFPTFHKWKNWEQLLEFYKFYVYPRNGSQDHELTRHPSVKVFDAPMVEISASFIREAIRNGKNMSYFLPEKSYKYIREMHFYEK